MSVYWYGFMLFGVTLPNTLRQSRNPNRIASNAYCLKQLEFYV